MKENMETSSNVRSKHIAEYEVARILKYRSEEVMLGADRKMLKNQILNRLSSLASRGLILEDDKDKDKQKEGEDANSEFRNLYLYAVEAELIKPGDLEKIFPKIPAVK